MLENHCKDPSPWEGCRVKPWDDSVDISDCEYTWKNQRLYKDKTDTARLCHIVKKSHYVQDQAPSLDHICVEFAWCGKQMWVREDQLRWPDWLGIDQKLYQREDDDKWMIVSAYTTHVLPTKRDVILPKNTGPMVDRSQLISLQSKVEALQKYPSGEVTGTLMWDLSKRVFCVQPESATQYIDLMEATLDHGAVFNSRDLMQELQFPDWYESAGVWEYQLLRYLQPVDMSEFREGLDRSWEMHGQERPPLELFKLEAKRPIKFYPVDDGLGGGAVFADNASAQEYLHLGEGRKMLRCADTKELGLAAIDAPGSRRSPPPPPQRRAATATGAGTSSAGAGPSGTKSPVREALTCGTLARLPQSPTQTGTPGTLHYPPALTARWQGCLNPPRRQGHLGLYPPYLTQHAPQHAQIGQLSKQPRS
ncbi:hypothetical protein CYMTET_9335 [Cymbomonas tetramitiformis]|uniref:Uncharacterized protein n=1 Tax=Cymbomonas tetramitiformis TaxID=36881 RepID=A0AAE0GRA4_9CHLO|nr:hypothetical protein CYMTET_9335 [Cymbomonas tetramitiformis]